MNGNKIKIYELIGAPAAFILLIFYFYRQSIHVMPFKLFDYSDHLLHVWILGWDAYALSHFPMKIFDANIFFPASNTLALSDHLFGLLPFWSIGYLIYGDFVAAHNFTYLAGHFVAASGAYFLFRQCRMNPVVSAVGSIFYTFYIRGFYISQIQTNFTGFAFFVFLFMDRYLTEKKISDIILMSVFYIIGFLTGFYFAYMLTLAVGLFLFIHYFIGRKTISWKNYIYILIAFVISILILSPTIYPYLKLGREGIIPNYSMNGLAENSISLALDKNGLYMLFTIGAGIILVALNKNNERNSLIIYIAIGLFFYMLALGPYLKFNGNTTSFPLPYQLFVFIPGFKSIRFVYRFYFMSELCSAFVFAACLQAVWPACEKLKLSATALFRACVFIAAAFFVLSNTHGKMRVENQIIMQSFTYVPGANNLPPIYKTLIEQVEPGPIVEFPLITDPRAQNYIYQYFSLFHHRSIFNGRSGHIPYGLIIMTTLNLPPEGWVEFFRIIGVKYIVSHPLDFCVRNFEIAWEGRRPPAPPLPGVDPARANSVIYIDAVENKIYDNNLYIPSIRDQLMKFGVDPGWPHFGSYIPADIGRDRLVIDLGHDLSKMTKTENIPPLPEYTSRNGGVLFMDHTQFDKFFADMGPAVQYSLLKNGIDRIDIKGIRQAITSRVNNPFIGLTEEQAAQLRITKVDRVDDSVVWKIDPEIKLRLLNEPYVKWELFMDENKFKAKVSIKVPAQTAWKNPNLYGHLKGNIKLRMIGAEKIYETGFFIELPLAITEYNPHEYQTGIDLAAPPGNYDAQIDVPGLSPRPYKFIANIK